MKNGKGVISVAPEHIEPGIKKYKGEIDKHLQAVIKAAGFDYIPYAFNDGRILLVLPNKAKPNVVNEPSMALLPLAAFLYDNEVVLSEALHLES